MILAIVLRLTGAFVIWYVLTYGLSGRQKDPVSHGRKVAAWVAASVVITTPSMHRNGPDLAVFILINGLVLGGVAFVVGYLWRKFRPVKELIASASPVMPVTSNSASTSQIVVAEKTYHSERSRRSNTPDTTEKIATKTSLNTVSSQSDEEFFAIAFQEVNSGNTVQGLWAKCFAETDGDENKTKARYLTARSGQLGAENAAIQFEAARVARMPFLKAEWLFGVIFIISIIAAFVIQIMADKSKSLPTNSFDLPLVGVSDSYGISHTGNCFITWDGFNFILAKPDETEKFEEITVDDQKQNVKIFIKRGLSDKDMTKIMRENYQFIEPLCRLAKK